jgi:glycosyltransferase involved in cell wall biosynthesis
MSSLTRATPTRVAFFLLDFSGGGTERVNINLANELVRRGYAVCIAVARQRGEFADRVDPRVQVHLLNRERAYECLGPLRDYLKSARPRVLFSCHPTMNLVAILANALCGFVSAVVPAEHMPVSFDRRENSSSLPRIAYRLYPLFYRLVPAVVVNCAQSAADFRREFPSLAAKVRILYNPVVTPELAQLAATAPSSALPQGDVPVLVGAGRLTRQKNFPLLLRAFARVLRERSCRLVIIGSRGEDKEALLELSRTLGIESEVTWTGFVDNPYAYFARASLFVLSSIYETLPTVLIEALACGTPVVATDCFGVKEILEEETLGEVVGDFEPESLAQAILRALDRPRHTEALRARGETFSVASASARYAALIEELRLGRDDSLRARVRRAPL